MRFSIRYVKVFLIVLLLSFSFNFLITFKADAVQKKYTVTLQENGFYPKVTKIQKGEVITFVTKRKQNFWPASNIHPLHNIYPEFDPKKPLASKDSWSFRFDKAGEWRFHDHLSPFFLGTIAVLNKKNAVQSEKDCRKLDLKKKEDCWHHTLAEMMNRKGVKAAFDLFKDIYKKDASFALTGCHLHAHNLGDIFYGEYKKNHSLLHLKFPPESIACGYGFYHGFFEHFFREENLTNEQARKFCDNWGKRYSPTMPRIRLNCYHAIGHGFMPDAPPRYQWGNPMVMMKIPLKKCEGISATNNIIEIRECMQGAFNVLSVWMAQKEYGLSHNEKDFFGVCRKQATYEHQFSCYYELSMRVETFAGRNLIKVAKMIADIKDDTIAQVVIHSAAASVIGLNIDKKDFEKYIEICKSLPSRLVKDCLLGMVGGLSAHGEPGKEYEKGLAFCSSPKLSAEKKELCYDHLFRDLKSIYQKEKVLAICTKVDKENQKHCRN